MKYIYILFVTLMSFVLPVYSAEIVTDFDTAMILAQEEQKNVLVIFTLQDCDPCNQLKMSLDIIKHVDNYIVCLLDTKSNKKLAGKFKLTKWPTSVILASSKEVRGEISRKQGFSKINYEKWLLDNAMVYKQPCSCDENCKCRVNGECKCSVKCECKNE